MYDAAMPMESTDTAAMQGFMRHDVKFRRIGTLH